MKAKGTHLILGVGMLVFSLLIFSLLISVPLQAQAQTQPEPQPPATPNNLPDAPSSSKTEPTLQELGFPAEQTQANAAQQALLDKRTHMLKIHQRMGLITAAP